MTMKEMMFKYFTGELDPIQMIRNLSGMFDPKHAVSLLTLICTITRHEQGDIDTETFINVWKFDFTMEEIEEGRKKVAEELAKETVQ